MLVAVFSLLPAAAQAQAIEAWVQRYNGPGNDHDCAQAVAVDSGGNVYVTGYSAGSDGPMSYATIKYSNTGEPLWTNRYNGPGNAGDYANALAVHTNGNVFVTGNSWGSGSGDDYATIAYSGAGLPLWTNRYDGPGNSLDVARAIALDASGNVFVTGRSRSTSSGGSEDYATLAYSGTGVLLWINSYDGPGNGWDEAVALAVDTSGNVLVTGASARNGVLPYNEDFATIKYSNTGVPLWTNRYDGPSSEPDQPYAVVIDHNGNAIVTGWSWGDFATVAYASDGTPLWTNRYNGPGNSEDWPYALAVDAAGNVVVAGGSYGSDGTTDYSTIKYSSAGVPLWTNRYSGPGSSHDTAHAVAVDAAGNAYVTGLSGGSRSGNDYATIAYSSAGVPMWTNRYNGPGNSDDRANAVTADADGGVYVTGQSFGTGGNWDYATVKYVTPSIFITRQPLSRTNAMGTIATFSVEVAGSAPFSYQWRRDSTNLLDGPNVSGVTTTNLLVANVQLTDQAGYAVVVTNAYGSVTSTVAQLTVTIPPSPGRFSNLFYSPETGLSFIFREGTVGKSYRIQVSPSLEGGWVDWTSFHYTAPRLFTDMEAVGSSNRFYRAVSP